ncbi:MAG: LLM class F420-dependent oxidoreductase, partial [Chloroflexi bacterium]|nr:LLM class F420-dependent oxidoreductase [Chloroflexota bacterium]
MAHVGRALAERIGPVGVWTSALDRMTTADAREAARRIEAIGTGALWIPETGMSKDIFAHAT